MASKIDKIFYINLDRRSDRRDLIEMDLAKIGLVAERFVGIPYEPGIVGCGKSHLAVMKLAKERGYKNVLILEDDFTFLVSKEELDVALEKFFSNVKEYDVCMLCGQNMSVTPLMSGMSKVFEANNASAYIINGAYLDALIELYERALPLLEQTGEHWNYANDQVWKVLQRKDNWLCFNPRLGKQRSGYSDNAKAFMDYEN